MKRDGSCGESWIAFRWTLGIRVDRGINASWRLLFVLNFDFLGDSFGGRRCVAVCRRTRETIRVDRGDVAKSGRRLLGLPINSLPPPTGNHAL